MVVGLLTPYFPDNLNVDSGIANHNMTLAKGLAEKGVKVIVIHIRPDYGTKGIGIKRENLDENITVVTCSVKLNNLIKYFFKNYWTILDFLFKVKSMIKTSLILERLIKEYQIELIEASSYLSLNYFSIYKSLSVPLVLRISTLYCQILSEHSPYRSRLLNRIGKMEIDLINHHPYLLTHADNHAKELTENFGIKNLIRIIPHGIRLPEIKNLDDNLKQDIKILYAGRMEYRKGTDILLRSIPLVLANFHHVSFEIIGSDPSNIYQKDFELMNPGLVNKKVNFRGKVSQEELDKAYTSCDVFVAPSRYESFGLVYIEAMSFGKPVIGAKVGGVTEIISDHENGLFFDLENPQDLADKISFLVKNKNIRNTMGINARKKIENCYTEKILSIRSIDYYKSLLK